MFLFDMRLHSLPVDVRNFLLGRSVLRHEFSSSDPMPGSASAVEEGKEFDVEARLSRVKSAAMRRLEIGGTLDLVSSGVLRLKNQHTVYNVIGVVVVVCQILVSVASLNVRPVGVGPTTWTTPDISFL